MIRADVRRLVEPVARRLRQDLPLEWQGGQVDVEGAQPVGGDDDAAAVGQVVILPHLAPIMAGQFRDCRIPEQVVQPEPQSRRVDRTEEHTSELPSLMRTLYA